MKEAFWGVLIVMLGLFGIVVINLFQKVTIDNDKVYYVIKESTEASMYDAVDLATYKLTGKLRMVEDKFVENLTRRFAQNISLGDYTITVQDINETPPYVSVMVKSNITSLKGEQFRISNNVSAILETKYTLDELLEFLDMTEEEWNNIQKDETDKNVCDMLLSQDDYECIPKDLKFGGWEDVNVSSSTCSINPSIESATATATYYECECGKWIEKEEELTSTATNTGSSIDYTWNFTKDGELRSINETMTRKTKLDICTTGVNIMVPKDLREKEPSNDNSQYEVCPAEGIRIPAETGIVLHGGYIPENATNRTLTWSKNGDAFALTSTNSYVSKKSYSRAIVTAGSVDKGETNSSVANTKTTLNQEANCNITVWDGSVDTISCENIEVYVGSNAVIKSKFTPYNATKTDFTYTSSNTAVATISGNTINAKSKGTTTITMTDTYGGKVTTCNIKVITASVATNYSGGDGYWKTVTADGKIIYSSTYEQAKKAAGPDGLSTISVSNGNGEIKYSTYAVQGNAGSAHVVESIYNGSSETQKTVDIIMTSYGTTTTTKDKDGNVVSTEKTSPGGQSGSLNNSSGTGNNVPVKKDNPPKSPPVAPVTNNNSSKGQSSSCLVSGTKISLANGKTKAIEEINYNDLLLVWNYETGKFAYEYPIWIEQSNESENYLLSTFSDGTTLKTVGDHSVFNTDLSEFVKVTDNDKYYIGVNILKKDNNNELKKVKVVNIETINEKVNYYYVITTRYFNMFADNVLTVDGLTEISNQYGFDNNYKWILYNDVIKDKNNLYSYSEFKNIPYYLFRGLRIEEGKFLVNMNYLTDNELKYYINSNVGNMDLTINPNIDEFENKLWKVTTSNNINDTKLYKEGSLYVLPKVTKLYSNDKKTNNSLYSKKKFIGWYNMGDGKMYNVGDKVVVNYGMHFEAIWR